MGSEMCIRDRVRKKGDCLRDAEVELRMVIRVGNLSSHVFWSATVFVFLRRNEIIIFCQRSTMPLDWAWPTLDVVCWMLNLAHNACISELMFSVPRSVTSSLGQPKYGMIKSQRMETTDCEVLFSMAVAKINPVAASTAVQMPIFPEAERGMESRSI